MKGPRLDIMLPVYHGNLAEILLSIQKQIDFYEESLKNYDWRIVLAINGQNADEVIRLAKELGKKDKRISFNYVEQSGKGSGIIHAWSMSNADIISYMDIDLSTDISNFPDLVEQIKEGYDISIGSRYHPSSKVTRSWKRRLVSFAYHKIFMKIIMGAKSYTDGQCGFKAVNRKVLNEILPLIRNRNWFFESEMLYIAEHKGFRIKEVPVIWVESEFSGMSLYRAIFEFIRCGIGLRFRKII
jgi:glycosyltransferase involved in cell wall biosynthesis